MTSKERLTASLKGEETDYIPFSPFLAYFWDYQPQKVRDAGLLEFYKFIDADPLWRGPGRGAVCPVKAQIPGVEYKTFNEGDKTFVEMHTPVGMIREGYIKTHATTFLVEHPLKNEEDYKVQLWMEENTQFRLDLQPVRDHFNGQGREGLSVGMLVPRNKSAFQDLIEHLAGTEALTYALADYSETVEELWSKMVENNLKAVKMAVESEYEYFLTFEDSSTLNYSPAQYSRYIAEEIKEWCSILSSAGKFYIQHACGSVKGILKSMKESGVYAVESLTTPPTGDITLREARSIAGKEMGIIGGIEPTMLLNLSEKELIPYVEGVISDLRTGPFILANADSCPPDVTVEKLKLISRIAKNYR